MACTAHVGAAKRCVALITQRGRLTATAGFRGRDPRIQFGNLKGKVIGLPDRLDDLGVQVFTQPVKLCSKL